MTEEFKQRYVAARRRLIEGEFSRLNPPQRQAVMATEGPLLLLAGAGSGKTTVLISRIVNLVKYGCASDSDEVPSGATEEDIAAMEAGPSDDATWAAALRPAQPWEILAITFTNKAAGELKSRLAAALGPKSEEIWAQTFHSACVRILRANADRLGYSRDFTIYDTADSQSVVKRIVRDMNLDEKKYASRPVLSFISKSRDELITPEAMLAQANAVNDVYRKGMAMIYAEYTRRLKDADAMDFDDLLANAVKLLQENEDVRTHYQHKFHYVLIDEYQDTNNMQYLFAGLIAGGHQNICVVGDDDQSIYKFRGATIKNILEFEHLYKNARVIKLEQNYRSTGHILCAANAVIANNTSRKGKRLWTDADMGEMPVMFVARDQDAEAQYIADKIFDLVSEGGRFSDSAVLYRLNAQSNALEYAMKRRGIPYRIYGGTRFFDRAEIKDILAYMWVAVNPADDLRLIRIINTPARGIGDLTVERAATIAQEQGTSIFDVISGSELWPELERTAAKLKLFSQMIDALRESAETLSADKFFDELIEKTGYIRALEAKATQENQTRIENVRELKSNIITFMNETGDDSIHAFLDEVALYTDLDTLDPDADCVAMMTIHSAKGLEFPNVFIAGAEENIFPSMRVLGDNEELEEERRLCYVAITRAQRRLFITAAKQRMLFGHTSYNRTSRFLGEIPDEHIERPVETREWSYGSSVFAPAPAAPAFTAPPRTPVKKPAADKKAAIRAIITAETKKTPPSFKVGDMVEHRSFGNGMIVSMTPMGGDFLVEVAFDGVGTKRLMLRAASMLMKKLS
ncbi:MAG: UvrD-helicase domain-containing protein [Oscillospiraceae bacterium]|nr:UvrD-helicase domain-containing protein [Oscillospiraceae bacterium]